MGEKKYINKEKFIFNYIIIYVFNDYVGGYIIVTEFIGREL